MQSPQNFEATRTDFRTTVDISQRLPFSLTHKHSIMLLGSCFTQNIFEYLHTYKYKVFQNPFGILYNPDSIAQCLEYMAGNKQFEKHDLEFYNDLWFSLLHHSQFSNTSSELCLQYINAALLQAQSHFQHTHCAFVTWGSAWAFEYIPKPNFIVGNCHKLPAQSFKKHLLTSAQIVARYVPILEQIFAKNTELKIVFTVSPIRHWNYGAIDNQISKAHLLLAAHELCGIFPHQVFYFPAYELLLDDLRDYRFYAADMLHPSPVAIEYIWHKLQTFAFYDSHNALLIKKIKAIAQAYQHRPFNEKTEAFKLFAQKQLNEIEALSAQFSFLDFETEKKYFLSKI